MFRKCLHAASATLTLALSLTGSAAVAQSAAPAPDESRILQSAQTVQFFPYSGTIRIVKPGRGGRPQPLVTTCSAGVGESCALFASNCLVAGGYYDGDGAGGVCCSGVDHPDQNPGSACN